MKLKDLKEFLTEIPDQFDDYELVNGEYGLLDATDENSAVFRADKPIITMYVDIQTQEVCFLHQTQEVIDEIKKNI